VTTTAPRRELILEAAADLFAAKGYHAVGIDDVGEAAGITGPGVYRHFSSKQAILATLIERSMDRMLSLAEGISDLDTLIDLHVTLVTEERALIGVWVREQAALDEEVQNSLRPRMRRYEQVWRTAVTELRPELGRVQLTFVVGATLAMLNTTSLIDSQLSAADRRDTLRRLVQASLHV
jgi:AcrR family transcriptional regulator